MCICIFPKYEKQNYYEIFRLRLVSRHEFSEYTSIHNATVFNIHQVHLCSGHCGNLTNDFETLQVFLNGQRDIT